MWPLCQSDRAPRRGWRAVKNAAVSSAKYVWKHRSAIVHTAIGFGASAIGGAVAVGTCGATGGIGCLVVAGVMTRVAIGSVAHPVADRVLGDRTTGRDVLNYAIKDALGGGGAGILHGAYRRGVLGVTAAKLRGQAVAKPGSEGFRALMRRNPWEHRR